MRVGIYTGASHPVGPALAEGFSSVGAAPVGRSSQWHRGEVEKFDLVVVYGARSGARVRAVYETAGVPVVTVDWGYMARVNSREEHHVGHFQVGLGGLNTPPAFECPPDRFKALGIPLRARGGDPKGYTLLIGQVPGDAAHGMDTATMRKWLATVAGQYDDVHYRPHPRWAVTMTGARIAKGSLDEALAGARQVVVWNSNTGHDALLAGVPVIAHGCVPYADLCGPKVPGVAKRRAYFHRLAYGQWTLAEMRSGECQRFILNHLLPGESPVNRSASNGDAE